ncbi:MAG TPA: hypothetical protein VL026_13915 [Rhizomicrobium sp.]|nr:hypothetical protein [Rhizomicrobium sp.]
MIFSEILRGLGLSQAEATDFLRVRPDTLESWSAGQSENPPPGVMAALHGLADRQDEAACEAREAWEESGAPSELKIGLATDDFEAQQLGWPCVGAHRAVIRRLWEMLPSEVTLIVVPRGDGRRERNDD